MSIDVVTFIAALAEFVAGIIHKKTGKAPDSPDVKAIAEAIVREVIEGGTKRLEAALQEKLAVMGLAFELRELGTVLESVDDWFKPKGEIPQLGLDITVLPADEPK